MSQPRTLRRRISDAFSDQDLRNFCFDYFRPVYELITIGMAKDQMVQLLLDYCVRHGYNTELLDHLESERPRLIGNDRVTLLVALAPRPTAEQGLFTDQMGRQAYEIAKALQDLRAILAGGGDLT